jgi:hypothetical protein
MAPAVGSGEGAAEGELMSHPANSASATSNTVRVRKQFFIDLPSDLLSDARHSSALPNDCQGEPNIIEARELIVLSKQHYISNVALIILYWALLGYSSNTCACRFSTCLI